LHFLPLSTGVAATALLDTTDPDVIYGVICGVEVFSYRVPRRPVANAANHFNSANLDLPRVMFERVQSRPNALLHLARLELGRAAEEDRCGARAFDKH